MAQKGDTNQTALQEVGTGSSPSQSGSSKLIMGVLVVMMVLDLLSLGAYWFKGISDLNLYAIINNRTHKAQSGVIKSAYWPEFVKEARFYKGMKPTRMLIRYYSNVNRSTFGNVGPFLDYLFLKILRTAGFLLYFSAGLIVVAFIAAEAYRRNRDKRLNFEKMSSTVYHSSLHSGMALSISIFFVYLFMPGKIVIPGITKIDVPFFLYMPYLSTGVIIAMLALVVYLTISNITYNI